MTSGTRPEFREAAKHEHELNERQREILRLIEKGHTNREIAEMLGVSVDGAKWNVSEILSKLGLASREEAGEYWRWRHGGVWQTGWRRLRSLLAAPIVRVAATGGAMALVTGAVALALLRDEPPDRPVPGSFYLEARFQIESPVGISRNLYAKYWWRDGTHWRQEIEDRTPSPGAGTRIVVWNQDRQWEWDSRLNQTTEFNVEGSNPDAQLFSLPNWLPYLALAPVRLEAPSIDEYISRVNSSARGVTVNARRVGVDGALVGIELRQTGSEAAAPKTIWVEPDRLFIVRAQSSLPAVSASNVSAFYEVTRLEHEPRLTDDLFEFTPPSGSIRQQGQNVAAMYFPRSDDAGAPTPYQDVSGGLPLRMAPPFLSMGSLPERFVAWGEHSMPGADGAVAAVVTTFGDSKIQDPNQPYKGPYLLVEQQRRVDGLPGALRVGEGVDINGSPGFVVSEAGECSVAWLSGGVAVRLSSDVLTADELLELARGMYLRAN